MTSISNKCQSLPIKAHDKPSTIQLSHLDMVAATSMCKGLDIGNPVDLTQTIVTNSSANTSTHISAPLSNGDVGGSTTRMFCSDYGAFYDVVGPTSRESVTDGTSNGSTPTPPQVPVRNGTGHQEFHHTLEGPMEYSAVVYEEQTQPKFRVR